MASSTVIAKKAIDADALATIVFLRGAEKGIELVERLKGVEALIITEKGEVVRSSNFWRYESWFYFCTTSLSFSLIASTIASDDIVAPVAASISPSGDKLSSFTDKPIN